MPAPGAGAPTAPAIMEEPPKEAPTTKTVPGPTGTAIVGEERMTATGAAVVVVDLEDGELAAHDSLEAGQAEPIADPPAEAEKAAEEAPSAAGAEKTPLTGPPAAAKPRAEVRKPAEKRKEPESSTRQGAPCPTRPRVDGPQEKRARPGPALTTMGDAQEASCLLSQVLTPESAEEMRRLPPAAILDMMMVSIVQAANGAMGIREVIARFSGNLSKANDRANKYKKECATQSQSLARLRDESRAREEKLQKQITEGERRAREAAVRISALETERDQAAFRLKTLHARAEEQDHQLQEAQRQVMAAQDEIRAVVGKAADAEKAAAEALAEKAGAVACADEASARAGEAENKAWEAEMRAKEAEAKALKAVEDYKSSPDFKKEVIEAGLDAFVKGFDACKAKVSEVLKIDDSDLEKIQPVESDEEQEEGEGGEGAGAGGP